MSFRKSITDDRVQDAIIAKRDEEILIVSESATMCRQSVGKISTQKREAQGVRIMKCDPGDFVTAMSVVRKDVDVIE